MSDTASAAHSAAATCHFWNTPDNGVKGLTVTITPLLIAEEQAMPRIVTTTSPPATTPSATPAAPRADPPSSHTHVQHSCDRVRSGVVKGLGPDTP